MGFYIQTPNSNFSSRLNDLVNTGGRILEIAWILLAVIIHKIFGIKKSSDFGTAVKSIIYMILETMTVLQVSHGIFDNLFQSWGVLL